MHLDKKRLSEKYADILSKKSMSDEMYEYCKELEKFEKKDKKMRIQAEVHAKILEDSLKKGKLPRGIKIHAGRK